MLSICVVLNNVPCCLSVLRHNIPLSIYVSELFFSRSSPLHKRFSFLFHSLFGSSGRCHGVMRILSRGVGKVAHGRLVSRLGLGNNKRLSRVLRGLGGYSFVEGCTAVKGDRESTLCRLASLCSLFCAHFITGGDKRSGGF